MILAVEKNLQIITYFNLLKLYIVRLLNLFQMSLFLPEVCLPEIWHMAHVVKNSDCKV